MRLRGRRNGLCSVAAAAMAYVPSPPSRERDWKSCRRDLQVTDPEEKGRKEANKNREKSENDSNKREDKQESIAERKKKEENRRMEGKQET